MDIGENARVAVERVFPERFFCNDPCLGRKKGPQVRHTWRRNRRTGNGLSNLVMCSLRIDLPVHPAQQQWEEEEQHAQNGFIDVPVPTCKKKKLLNKRETVCAAAVPKLAARGIGDREEGLEGQSDGKGEKHEE